MNTPQIIKLSCALTLAFAVPVSAQTGLEKYFNADAGLEMSYPGTWQAVQESTVHKALASKQGVEEVSQEDSEATSYMALTLVKKHQDQDSAQNATAGVVVVPLPPEQAANFDLDAQVQALMSAARGTPGAEVTADALPLPSNPGIRNFSVRTATPDRTTTQYQYIYWRPPHFVQISFNVSRPEDEEEVKEIVRSIKIDEPAAGTSE